MDRSVLINICVRAPNLFLSRVGHDLKPDQLLQLLPSAREEALWLGQQKQFEVLVGSLETTLRVKTFL